MQYNVVKPFNTVNRRLALGATIRDDEVIEPWTFDERRDSGFIKSHDDEGQPTAAPIVATPAAKKSAVAPSDADKAASQ